MRVLVRHLKEKIIEGSLFISALFAVISIFLILVFLLNESIPIFRETGIGFLMGDTWKPEGEILGFKPSYGALPLILATLLSTLGAITIAVPLAIGSAIFISEIAPEKLRNIVKPAIELLAGIPSVVYGFFGLIVLVNWFQINFNVASGEGWLAASIILAIMTLPTIASVAEDAISSVPRELREGSLALGATKWQTIENVVLPAAFSGIIAAIILGIGRAIGETMAVMMVIGNSAQIPNIFEPFKPLKTLTSAIAIEMGEAPYNSMWQHSLYGLAVILLIIVLLVNIVSNLIMDRVKNKSSKNRKGKLWGRKIEKTVKLILVSIALLFLLIVVGWKLVLVSLLILVLIYLLHRYPKSRFNHILSVKNKQRVAFGLILLSVIITLSLLSLILYYIIVNGCGAISWEFLTQSPRNLGREGGVLPAIIGTILLATGAIAFALPIGVGAAVYLNEYTRESKMKRVIRIGADLLNGTPSIVFGLFGLTFFVLYLKFGVSLLAGQLTLALMILPTIIRTTEETLKSIPRGLREASLALGATKWQTTRKIVLPAALPGIMTGTILSMGRAAGETAPILFTAAVFSQKFLPSSLFQPVMALPYHLFILSTSIPGVEAKINAAGTTLVLLMIVLMMYATAIVIRTKYRSRW
ncbi:MAG TPA: phosphate ABC transporter permease PstA [Thermoplasmatales archaeon]|nr:phosphate ABC transporter permease PstA [Thermoplasmatales archaeon]